MDSAGSAFDAAVSAHLDAAALLRGARADAREDNVQVKQMQERLASQAARLGAAAGQLGLPAPRLSVESAPATPDIGAALSRAESALRQADTELDKVLRPVSPPVSPTSPVLPSGVAAPVLMPGASPGMRAALVYGGYCLLAWFVQFTLLAATDYHLLTTVGSLCGMPLLAFGAGMLTLHLLGQPRAGERIAYSAKLGAVICFAGLPLMWLVLLVAFAVLRG